jgi:maltoporin
MLRLTAALLLATNPLAAQDFYGNATLSLGQSQTVGAPIAIQGANGTLMTGRTDLTFGRLAANGLYVQADLGLSVTNNNNSAPNTANSSTSLTLRAGRDANYFGYGAFLGAIQSDHDNDATDDALRMLAGIEGAYSLNDRWDFNAHVGYLAGDSGTDSAATVTNGIFTGVGIQYAATDRLSLGTSIDYLNAKMDAPQNVVELWTLELRADYDIAAVPGMSLFAAAQYGESHQKEVIGPDDITDTTTLMVGLTYSFGKKAPKTTDLTYLAPYLSNTGGILE